MNIEPIIRSKRKAPAKRKDLVTNLQDDSDLFIIIPRRCMRKGCRGRVVVVQIHQLKNGKGITWFLCQTHGEQNYGTYLKGKQDERKVRIVKKEDVDERSTVNNKA